MAGHAVGYTAYALAFKGARGNLIVLAGEITRLRNAQWRGTGSNGLIDAIGATVILFIRAV